MRLPVLRNAYYLTGSLLVLLAVSPAARADYKSTVLSQGPVGYWRLNETTPPPVLPILATNAGSVGASGNGEYLDADRGLTNSAIAGDPSGHSVGFSGLVDGNRVRIPFQPQWNQSGPMTIEFWAKPAQTNGLACPAASVEFIPGPPAQRNGWLCYQGDSKLGSGSGWIFREYDSRGLTSISTASYNMSIDTNRWYHIVGVYDGTNISMYVNGVLGVTTNFNGVPRANTNSAVPLAFGARSDGVNGFFTYSGAIDEGAIYDTALSPARILAHYQAGTNTAPPTPYNQVVLADSPAGYWRFNEPPDPPAANLGTLGGDVTGSYIYDAAPGAAGPRPPGYPGFEAGNNAVSFDGVGGYVSVPALNLNTNTVTITGWINANGPQNPGTGIIFNRSGTTTAGLTVDIGGGLGLSYNWDNDPSTFNWASGVSLTDSDWTYVALVIQPTQAALYAAAATNATTWNSGTNFTTHLTQAFEGPTWFAADLSASTNLYFKGLIDEVAIFNRALSEGEVYSAYGSAIGRVAPQIFTDVAAPPTPPYLGETLNLLVDAGGTPALAYHWRKGGTAIAGATSSALIITNLQASDAGTYDVVITNSFGTATSSQAVITIQTPTTPVISQGPIGRTLYQGGLLDLVVVATGGQLQYQWQKGGTTIPGATTSAYIVNSVAGADAGAYKVSVTNSLGSASAGPVTVNVIVPATNTYEATIVADGPEAWWRLDEPSGSTTMLDAMGRHDGTYIGSGVTLGAPGVVTNGAPNTAVTLNGTDSYGDVPYSSALNSPEFTIEGWALLTDLSAQRAVVSTYDTTAHKGLFWKANPDGTLESDVGLNDNFIYYFAPMGTIASGRWVHLVSTFSNSAGQINYLNGQQISGPFNDFVRNSKFHFLIGAVGTNFQGIARWKGTLDEVAVYKRALTSDQIQNHYVQAIYGSTTKPIFLAQPNPVTRVVGDVASLSAKVEGSLPIALQWYKDGIAVPKATNDTLPFGRLALTDSGHYQLGATNSAGTNTSISVALTVLPTVAFANATNGLVLHLKFDGDYADSSGRGNNGTPVGSPKFIQGQIGQALHYSTATDTNGLSPVVTNANYVTLGRPSDLLFGSNTSFSVAFWVRLPDGYLKGDLPFFGSAQNSANNQGFTFCPSYKLGGWQWDIMEITAGGVTNNVDVNGPDGSINDGIWHHFAVTFDRSAQVALTYLDGEQVNSTSIASVGTFDSTNSISIGQDPTGLYPEEGSADLDDLGVWHRVLTPLEVYDLNYSGVHYGASLDAYGPVSLAVVLSPPGPIVVWQAGTLVQADALSGPWSPVTGATAPSYTVTPGTGAKFYRVKL
jgi:hypothetical protein